MTNIMLLTVVFFIYRLGLDFLEVHTHPLPFVVPTSTLQQAHRTRCCSSDRVKSVVSFVEN